MATAASLDGLRGESRQIVALRAQVARLLARQAGARRPPADPDPRRDRHRQGPPRPLRSTRPARVATARSSVSTAPRFPRPCWKPSSSATSAAPSPTRATRSPASSRPPRAARCSSTRSACCPTALQGKLLTVLEDRAVRRLGGTRAEPVDVALRGGDERRAPARRLRRPLPRGSLPSPRRHHPRAAAAARPRRRHPRPGRLLPGAARARTTACRRVR